MQADTHTFEYLLGKPLEAKLLVHRIRTNATWCMWGVVLQGLLASSLHSYCSSQLVKKPRHETQFRMLGVGIYTGIARRGSYALQRLAALSFQDVSLCFHGHKAVGWVCFEFHDGVCFSASPRSHESTRYLCTCLLYTSPSPRD